MLQKTQLPQDLSQFLQALFRANPLYSKNIRSFPDMSMTGPDILSGVCLGDHRVTLDMQKSVYHLIMTHFDSLDQFQFNLDCLRPFPDPTN